MWSKLLHFTKNKEQVIAQAEPSLSAGADFDPNGYKAVLAEMQADQFHLDENKLAEFIEAFKTNKKLAVQGVRIAEKKDARVIMSISEDGLIASMVVYGACGGKRSISPAEIMRTLQVARVTKGINKVALGKVISLAQTLLPHESYTQPVAKGEPPINGKDSQFVPLIEDMTKKILVPQIVDSSQDKVDMRDLGQRVSVMVNQPLMKRIPAKKGTPGMTVQGKAIEPRQGKNKPFSIAKGSRISDENKNLLVADIEGIPVIAEASVKVEPALIVKAVDVSTGHVDFNGSLIVNGDIETDMKVKVTGSISVGGFIESANVEAGGDITVGKGIIGRKMEDDTDNYKTCIVKSGGAITAKYAQSAEIHSKGNIDLTLYCMSSIVHCDGQKLRIMDRMGRKGTLSGGKVKCAGKIISYDLGVEGNTPTSVEPFSGYLLFKEQLAEVKEQSNAAQAEGMDLMRAEMNMAKLPKAERDQDKVKEIKELKEGNSQRAMRLKLQLNELEKELENRLEQYTVMVKNKVFPRVKIQYGNDVVLTKKQHDSSKFYYNQYEIKRISLEQDT